MKCPYCGNEDRDLFEIQDQSINNEITGIGKKMTIIRAEYFCLICQSYFTWDKYKGLILTDEERD